MSNVQYYTKDGYENLRAELQDLKGRGRKEIADQIQKAREMGDLSENAEYDAAKDAQGILEMKIAKLETLVANARILNEADINTSKAYILSTVTLKNLKNKQKVKYTLVAEKEANLRKGKISVQSPVGKAILGKEVGDIIEIKVPAGKLEFELIDISRG